MQCLQTQRLDPIPQSPALQGCDARFAAAFCRVGNWQCWQGDTGEERTPPGTSAFTNHTQILSWCPKSISESVSWGAVQIFYLFKIFHPTF